MDIQVSKFGRITDAEIRHASSAKHFNPIFLKYLFNSRNIEYNVSNFVIGVNQSPTSSLLELPLVCEFHFENNPAIISQFLDIIL